MHTNRYFAFLFALLLSILSFAQSSNTNRAYWTYIDTYKEMAMEQQQKYKIPASITLAQGLLESGAGRSRLAREANNHFGIKCHTGWTGERTYHDDDARQECFRKQQHVSESYDDHSLFLTSRSRYAELFKLKPTDYKAWAHGLKKAGYATDPNYAHKLINTSNNPNYISNAYYCLMHDAKEKNDAQLLSTYSHARTDAQKLLRDCMIKDAEALPLLEEYLKNPHPLRWVWIMLATILLLCIILFVGVVVYRHRNRIASEQIDKLSTYVENQEALLLPQQEFPPEAHTQ